MLLSSASIPSSTRYWWSLIFISEQRAENKQGARVSALCHITASFLCFVCVVLDILLFLLSLSLYRKKTYVTSTCTLFYTVNISVFMTDSKLCTTLYKQQIKDAVLISCVPQTDSKVNGTALSSPSTSSQRSDSSLPLLRVAASQTTDTMGKNTHTSLLYSLICIHPLWRIDDINRFLVPVDVPWTSVYMRQHTR